METIFDFSPLILGAIPVVMGLVEVVKRAGFPPERFIPLLSLVLGIAIMAVIEGPDWPTILIQGIIVGLSASGLWSGGKSIINK